jgi:hypothetical protein
MAFDEHGSGGNGASCLYIPAPSVRHRHRHRHRHRASTWPHEGQIFRRKKRFWLPLYAASTGHTLALLHAAEKCSASRRKWKKEKTE